MAYCWGLPSPQACVQHHSLQSALLEGQLIITAALTRKIPH